MYGLGRLSILRGLVRADGDVAACIVIVACTANVCFVENVEGFPDEAEGHSLVD